MSKDFATADLYDANEGKVQVALPLFKSYGNKNKFYGQIVTLKCHEDNTLVGDILRQENGIGKVLVIDGGGSLRCALVGDLIAAAAVVLTRVDPPRTAAVEIVTANPTGAA